MNTLEDSKDDIKSPACASRAGGASSFNQRERARVGLSPMLVISQHRSRKGTPQ